jgi:hypothetical protein
MGTFTPEEIAAIPGSISSAELYSQAVATGKKVKYYLILSKTLEVGVRYITPAGNITNGKGKRYGIFRDAVPRFTNYWHAYAYQCHLRQQRRESKDGSD